MGFSQAYGPAADDESLATIRHALDLGVSMLDTAMSYGAATTNSSSAALSPGGASRWCWSLFWREPEDDVIPAARRLGIGLVPYSPLGRGMLTGALPGGFATGDFRGTDPRFAGDSLAHNLAPVDAVAALAAERGVTAGQLGWPGSWPKAPTWCPSRAPAAKPGSRRTPPPRRSSCPAPNSPDSISSFPGPRGPEIDSPSPPTAPHGTRYEPRTHRERADPGMPAMTGFGWADTKPFFWLIDQGTVGTNMHLAAVCHHPE